MLAETVEIDEAALRAAYDARIAEFVQPERRMVDRLGFADAETAEAAAAAIAAGESSFADLLAERGLTEEDVDLGIVAAVDLGEAAEGVFALEDTGVAGPLPSPVGPALFRVNAILTAQETGFDDARTALRVDLALDRAVEVLADEVEALEDLLAGGATLEELAEETDMVLGQIDWTGAETEGAAGYPAFAEAAAAVTIDDFPEITALSDGGIFALRLNEVVAAELQPLDAVRAEAERLAALDKRNAALAERAETMIPQLNAGGTFEAAGLVADRYDAVSRRNLPPQLASEVLQAGFELTPLETRLVDTETGPVVVRLEAIVPASQTDPVAEAVRNSVTQEAATGIARDILTAVARSVEAEAGISTNPAAINAVHAQLP
jgi:peptidyl-prolyl cis-trans isomerase D